EIQGSGVTFQVGQSAAPGMPWPQFNIRTFTRVVNYETASFRQEILQTRALEPPRGGGAYIRGEHKLVTALSGDHAWNVTGDTAVPAPITLADRQFQLWSTPHGVVQTALAGKGMMQGRTIVFGVPGRFKATAFLDTAGLIERIEATMSNPVLGDMPVTVSYAEYRDFGGMKFPTKIRQTYGGFPALELTVTEVRPNAAADIQVPDNVRQAASPYARVATQSVVDGVRDQRSLTDGTRTVEVRHIAGSLHADDLLMVYLPKEKFLIEADAYTPPAPNATPMTPPSAFTVNLVENITKQGLAVDQIL